MDDEARRHQQPNFVPGGRLHHQSIPNKLEAARHAKKNSIAVESERHTVSVEPRREQSTHFSPSTRYEVKEQDEEEAAEGGATQQTADDT